MSVGGLVSWVLGWLTRTPNDPPERFSTHRFMLLCVLCWALFLSVLRGLVASGLGPPLLSYVLSRYVPSALEAEFQNALLGPKPYNYFDVIPMKYGKHKKLIHASAKYLFKWSSRLRRSVRSMCHYSCGWVPASCP